MTQEDKELLLKYLCMALPYGVKTKYVNTFCKIKQIVFEERSTSYLFKDDNFSLSINDIQVWKPYLRSMSSMTEEERKELQLAFNIKASVIGRYGISSNEAWWVKDRKEPIGFDTIPYKSFYGVVDWLNAHHFDYRGLIEKGLVIEVTKENNPYKD